MLDSKPPPIPDPTSPADPGARAAVMDPENATACHCCGFGNAPDTAFCDACGSPLDIRCPTCHSMNPPRFNFCGTCGSALRAVEAAPVTVAPTTVAPVTAARSDATASSASAPSRDRRSGPRGPQAERRQLTVMFCDIVDSTSLSLQVDPEVLREVVRSYQATCAEAIERFGGYIAQYLGDGVLAYFGYPIALENEAERAVRAGLEVLAGLDRLNRDLLPASGIRLAVRIGIHTGLVVVGEIGSGSRREHLALGGTPNIAARLQSAAAPGTLVVSGETHRLIARAFETEDLGRVRLKGVMAAESVHRVVGERHVRLEAGPGERIGCDMIGRDRELDLLLEQWREAAEARGQVVAVVGEPGIGKSHLLRAFRARIESEPCSRLEFRCQPYHQTSPFHPFIELLQKQLGCDPELSAEDGIARIESLLDYDGFPLADTVPLVASLLSIPTPARYTAPALSPQAQHERTRGVLLGLLLRAAADQPLVLLGEDLHWADPSTLELMELLAGRIDSAHMLALCTSRKGYDMRWLEHPRTTRVVLGRLEQKDVKRIVGQVTGGRRLPEEVLQQVVARTDGVPLFAEELTKMVLESDMLKADGDAYTLEAPLPPLAIPMTLQDSLEARLDRLSTVKAIAQLGATIGREFTYAQINAIAYVDEPELRRSLDQLVAAELLYQEGEPPRATYSFKHALIQEAAYQSLLRSTRQRHHQRIARALESQFPDIAASRPELLAHHWAAAGMKVRAVDYWRQAALRALAASANAEAVAHAMNGLEAVATVEDGSERSGLELELQATLGTALTATRGHAAREVRAAYSRARQLAQTVGDTPHLSQVLVGLFAFYLVRGELDVARELGQDLLALAGRLDDPAVALAGHAALGVAHFAVGDGRLARPHLDNALAAYDIEKHARLAITHGQDFYVVSLAYSALLDWIDGFPDRALERSGRAVAHAERIAHAQSLALALTVHGSIHAFREEAQETREAAERLQALAAEQKFAHWAADAMFLQAWVLARQGQQAAAVERAEQAIAAYGLGERLPRHRFDIILAETWIELGRHNDALEVLERTEAARVARGTQCWEPELCRLHGELLMARPGREADARHWLDRAFSLARERGARMLELRAANSRARLDERTGVAARAANDVADLYLAFTEGFNLPDLIEARRRIEASPLNA